MSLPATEEGERGRRPEVAPAGGGDAAHGPGDLQVCSSNAHVIPQIRGDHLPTWQFEREAASSSKDFSTRSDAPVAPAGPPSRRKVPSPLR